MSKITLAKPTLICLYGYPGSGKSYVARNLTNDVQLAHVSSDRIRSELFQQPRYDAQENAIVMHLMDYMAEEFLGVGVSVVYDANTLRSSHRRKLREMARKHKADYLLIWIQIDMDSAYSRTQTRDRRTADDKFAEPQTKSTFERQLAAMQNPQGEDYLVISGKHSFNTQKSAIVSRLYQMGLIASQTVRTNVAKPELVNLIPHTRSPLMSRRNITID